MDKGEEILDVVGGLHGVRVRVASLFPFSPRNA